jgi:hypothetical protein
MISTFTINVVAPFALGEKALPILTIFTTAFSIQANSISGQYYSFIYPVLIFCSLQV